jgi:acetyl-CoA acetyltransferase
MSALAHPEKLVSITAVGQSEVGRPSMLSPLKLTVDACLAAIADAGLTTADIDGLATYPGAINSGDGFSPIGATETMAALGLRPSWVAASIEGHSHMGPIFAAIHAIAAGACRHVLVFRTVAQAQARARVHHAGVLGGGDQDSSARIWGWQSWHVPYHALSPVNMFALYAQAYCDKYGVTGEQLGSIAVHGRKMAALNPNAIYRRPITIEDYLSSRMISSPLRLYDCDTHIDGSTAILLSRREVACDLRQPPIDIEAMGMALGGIGRSYHSGDFTALPAGEVGDMLWSRTDLRPQDLDFAQIYDGFSILALLWIEALQLCRPGEAAAFVEGGSRIALDGDLPMNTSGGQLSAGRFHGYGHIHESCIQLWGRGGERQVRDARTGIVCNGGFGYGALLLRRD